MEHTKEQFEQSKKGSGSAEQTGRDRSSQENKNATLSDQERQNIAGQMGEGSNPVTSLKDMGAMSGRDDAAGGSGDRMKQESTGEPTDR